MRVLFAALLAHGPTCPLVPLTSAFQGLGAAVVFATRSPFEGRLPVPTVLGADPGWWIADAHAETFKHMPMGNPPTDDSARVLFVEAAAPHLLEPTCAAATCCMRSPQSPVAMLNHRHVPAGKPITRTLD